MNGDNEMSGQFTKDRAEPVLAAAKELASIKPGLSEEQTRIVMEIITAQHWAGYADGYKDAKQGNPNIVETLASMGEGKKA